MASLIPKSDFLNIITLSAIEYISSYDDDIIDDNVLEALITAIEYLGQRYPDIQDILIAEDGSGVHPSFGQVLKDIALYNLYSRHNKPMPEIRKQRYDAAIQWCKDIRDEKLKLYTGGYELVSTANITTGSTTDKRYNYLT